MTASKFSMTGKFKIAAYIVFSLMLLVSISAFRESPVLGFALSGIPLLFIGVAILNMIRKSVWGGGLLMFSIGVLEIYLGVAKGMPISWALGGAGFVIYLLVRFIKTAVGTYRAAFPEGDLPFPKVSPMVHSFDTAFGTTTRRKTSDSKDSRFDDEEMEDDTPNGRGGINPIFTEDDPAGFFL